MSTSLPLFLRRKVYSLCVLPVLTLGSECCLNWKRGCYHNWYFYWYYIAQHFSGLDLSDVTCILLFLFFTSKEADIELLFFNLVMTKSCFSKENKELCQKEFVEFDCREILMLSSRKKFQSLKVETTVFVPQMSDNHARKK